MKTSTGLVKEIFWDDQRAARIQCPAGLIPAPGQYVLAYADSETDAPLATPVFSAGRATEGFIAARPFPQGWIPGTPLHLRGPLGNGFKLPATARCVLLAALGESPSRLMAVLELALAQNASIVLACDHAPSNLPLEVEIIPLASLSNTLPWADYIALDLPRAAQAALPDLLGKTPYAAEAQALIETPVPCGGLADCGVCAVTMKRGYKFACVDGPVFALKDILA